MKSYESSRSFRPRLLLLALTCAVSLTGGCTSFASSPQPSQPAATTNGAPPNLTPNQAANLAAGTAIIAKNAVPFVLKSHPEYEVAVLAVADVIPTAFGDGAVTFESIRTTLAVIGPKAGLPADAQVLIASALTDGLTLYTQSYGRAVVAATDPNVRAVLTAFAKGLRDGVTLYHALAPTASASAPPPRARFFGTLGRPAIS